MPASSLAKLAMASVFAQVLPPAASVQPVGPTDIPELGAEWPGQGGFNGGLVAARGAVPAHYLVIAKEDVGDHKWGGRDKVSVAVSKTDGVANTESLKTEGDHPAAKAASAYSADGHADFYLPACAELYHCWVNAPELFAKDTWHWSSTQRSAYSAFGVHFDDGGQDGRGKGVELRVRPVRRFFI
jgi:hypothetical protein